MRLIVVSNRVTIPERHEKAAAGGLAVALREALEQRGGLWFGWSGAVAEGAAQQVRQVQRGNVTYAVTDLSEAERQSYYLGFSNRALWPLMHYRLGLTEDHGYAETSPHLLGLKRYSTHRRFAEAVRAVARR